MGQLEEPEELLLPLSGQQGCSPSCFQEQLRAVLPGSERFLTQDTKPLDENRAWKKYKNP